MVHITETSVANIKHFMAPNYDKHSQL